MIQVWFVIEANLFEQNWKKVNQNNYNNLTSNDLLTLSCDLDERHNGEGSHSAPMYQVWLYFKYNQTTKRTCSKQEQFD